jgi:NAD(P)-dependent dehydrogenase (short-subunit alcohol dehydrogenase family)
MSQSTWNISKAPSQKGKIVIVTGANAGLGYETALALAKKEATVIMACRNLRKAEIARESILKEVPQANLEIMEIDLSKLKSVRSFAKMFLAKYDALHVLINNAGVMMPPYEKTEDGFELQMGANYFGHFLLTGLLLETIMKTPESRVVSLSSLAHKLGDIHFDNLHWESDYDRMKAYQQSKLACLIFSFELQRRLERVGASTISVGAHPGISITELGKHQSKLKYFLFKIFGNHLLHKPADGALPTVMAAIKPDVKGGEYYGPTGNKKETKGPPGLARSKSKARDEDMAKRLWSISEDLTGMKIL